MLALCPTCKKALEASTFMLLGALGHHVRSMTTVMEKPHGRVVWKVDSLRLNEERKRGS